MTDDEIAQHYARANKLMLRLARKARYICKKYQNQLYSAWYIDEDRFVDYLMTLPHWDNLDYMLVRITPELPYRPGNLAFIPKGPRPSTAPLWQEFR